MARVLPSRTGVRFTRTACLLAVVATALLGRTAAAQNNKKTQMDVALSLTLPTPTIANYNAGFVCVGSATVTTSIDKGSNITDAIYVRSAGTAIQTTPTPTFSKAIGDLEFTTSGTGCSAASVWTPMPDANSPPAFVASGDTPFAVVMYFRLRLAWATDRGGYAWAVPDIQFWLNLPSANPP